MEFLSYLKKKLCKTPVYQLEEVFTPSSVANVSYIKRPAIENNLKKALKIPGKQIVIYGHSGSGKTTLLQHILKEDSVANIKSSCTNASTAESLMMSAFDELNPYFVESRNSLNSSSISAESSAKFASIKNSISSFYETSKNESERRILPPQLNMQNLGKFLGEAKAVWIIEDFHKVSQEEKTKIAQMMKLFMDLASDFKELKIIILGAANKGHEVISYDSELNNRISEIEVPLLTNKEIQEILEKGASALNIEFSINLINRVANYSNCLATIAHQLSYNMCYALHIEETLKRHRVIQDNILDQALKDFSSEKEATYKALYMRITDQKERTYRNVEEILNAMCRLQNEEVTHHEILEEIRKRICYYPASNLSSYLKKLITAQKEEVLRLNSGRYSFSDPFFKSYIIINMK